MIRPPPRSTRTDTRFPYTALCRAGVESGGLQADGEREAAKARGDDDRFPVHRVRFIRREGSSMHAWRPLWAPGAARTRCGCDPEASSGPHRRSEEHTSELQSLMRISYAVFCLKKKKKKHNKQTPHLK